MTYPHTRDPAPSADVSVCRCGSVRRPAGDKLAPTTWGSRCPAAMADRIVELEREVSDVSVALALATKEEPMRRAEVERVAHAAGREAERADVVAFIRTPGPERCDCCGVLRSRHLEAYGEPAYMRQVFDDGREEPDRCGYWTTAATPEHDRIAASIEVRAHIGAGSPK